MTNQKAIVRAAILLIGHELLTGRTRDANGHFLAQQLNALNIQVSRMVVVDDDEADIVAAVRDLSARYDYVFCSGGIGPTLDDITTDAVAAAFNTPVIVHEEAARRLHAHYGERINESRLRMARIPSGATLIDNPISAAPGFQLNNVYVLAGVPEVCQVMFRGLQSQLVSGQTLYQQHWLTGAYEGDLAPLLVAVRKEFSQIGIGSYPQFGQLINQGRAHVNNRVEIIFTSLQANELAQAAQRLESLAQAAGIELQRLCDE